MKRYYKNPIGKIAYYSIIEYVYGWKTHTSCCKKTCYCFKIKSLKIGYGRINLSIFSVFKKCLPISSLELSIS